MCRKGEQEMSLRERVQLAWGGVPFCKVMDVTNEGLGRTLVVPGHESRQYRVILRRKDGILSAECYLQNNLGNIPCQGNSNGFVCYHSLEAVIRTAQDAGFKVFVCGSEKRAKNLANTGGKVVPVRSWQGKGQVWIVTRKEK